MLAYCGRPSSASFCDRFPYICVGYARETIAESCSIWVALATAIITQTGSLRFLRLDWSKPTKNEQRQGRGNDRKP